MDTDDLGACIVAIPDDASIPVDVEGGAHVTLTYLGDDLLSEEQVNEILDILIEVSNDYPVQGPAEVLEVDYFGDDQDAVVLTLDPDSIFDDLRSEVIGRFSDDLLDVFEEAETFPNYRPHVTLGYISDGYKIPEGYRFPESVGVAAIALWNGKDKYIYKLAPESLTHYGTPRHSGRYPWGSGEDPYQNSRSFIAYVDSLSAKGMSDKDIAAQSGVSMRELRSLRTISKQEIKNYNTAQAIKLKQKQMSNVAIGKKLGVSEAQVRKILASSEKNREDKIQATSDILKSQLKEKKFLDVGVGTEHLMGISQTQLNAALTKLKMEGYRIDKIKVEQLGTGHETQLKVLSPPGTEYGDISRNRSEIGLVGAYAQKDGKGFERIQDPVSIDPKRVAVKYGEDGGTESDGTIFLRPGVADLSLGDSHYVQARIKVGEDHYLKGMALYSDDLPKGVDVMFNTNKHNTGNKLDAMKQISDDPDYPFGSVIRQRKYTDKDGSEKLSPINIVNEEGDWQKWSKTLSSQMLSKQPVELAKQQLDLSYASKRDELNEIQSLTNPVIKKKLLQSFSDGADSSAVSLKAAALPRTATHVILPVNGMKPNEIYAPKYKNGDRVVLIRHPHGGTFEIPELIVNNRNPEGKRLVGNASVDAVGIHHTVAERLSGADFDGDTVLVIPNNRGQIKTSSPLKGLQGFDPKESYSRDYETITNTRKQAEMGNVSNLITDMTIKGATEAELARAVRHSMVVIDSEKHKLDYKQSATDNGIASLKKKYQGGANRGASTIVSLASSEQRVLNRKPRMAKDGGPIDPKTGRKVYSLTGDSYVDAKGKTQYRTTSSTKMAETDDAHALSSGKPIERVYANYANKMKALANEARKEMVGTPNLKYSPTAAKAYAPQVAKLKADLRIAQRNAPLERQAQIVANAQFRAIKKSNPDMDKDRERKIKGQVLLNARNQVGAESHKIAIDPKQWEAIQSGAVSNNMLSQIIDKADLTTIKEYATPRANNTVASGKVARMKAMVAAGYTQAEVAEALGVSPSIVSNAIKG